MKVRLQRRMLLWIGKKMTFFFFQSFVMFLFSRSMYPPTIHNVKDAGNSILKIQLVHKSFLAGALDSIVGEVVIKVSEMAAG